MNAHGIASRTLLALGISAAAVVVLGLATPAAAQGYSQDQVALCQNDAFRLCGDVIPDVDRVTACMVRQRALLSPGCKSVFRPAGAETAPATRRKPTDLAPRKAVKGKKKARRSR